MFGFGGFAKIFLEHPWVAYLGKISYGLYVYRNFMNYIAREFLAPDVAHSVYMTPVYFVATVAVSALSWELFEHPINGLKDKVAAYLEEGPSAT